MLLQVDQLTKDYGRFRALDHLNLQIKPGEIVGLLGPNGSGKSTALRILLGFLRPTSGRATIAGHDCWSEGYQARRHVAYLPGELRLYENMTGRRIVSFLSALREQTLGQDFERLARIFDIDVGRKLIHLSSGMKRKVALLQVLLPRTPLVILDEPTNALDPNMRDHLLEQLVFAKARGQAVLFSSHVLAEVERVCDRVVILQRGKLVHVQDMAEVPMVRRVRLVHRPGVRMNGLLAGATLIRQTPEGVEFDFGGPLPSLLHWLASLEILDAQIRPLGLSSIYQRYHGAEA